MKYLIAFYDGNDGKELKECRGECPDTEKRTVIASLIRKMVQQCGKNITFTAFERDHMDIKWDDVKLPVSLIVYDKELDKLNIVKYS